jgi:DNA-binding SARP family transcriptional activator
MRPSVAGPAVPLSRLCLLGNLCVDNGPGSAPVRIPEGGKRLLVLLALHRRHVDRKWAAGVLWPNGNDDRATGNLRSSIWRLRGAGIDVLQVDKLCVGLAPHVRVDVDDVDEWAGRIVSDRPSPDDLCVHPDSLDAVDLLPGWYDEWVIMSRERLRHRVLHALEALSRTLSRCGRHQEAVEAAIVAASVEPLRDSAQRALMAAHVAEGNWNEAQRSCQVYVDLLRDELGIAPPRDLVEFLSRPWDHAAPWRIAATTVTDVAAV